MAKCLYYYKELNEGEKDFHKVCSKKMFGTPSVPELPYTRENLTDLAKQVIRSQTTLTGVQAKLSLDINKGGRNETDRFTIVGLWGRYILKPQTDRFAHLPELEDLTMHLAELSKMQVVPHSLIRFADGELCYITRRIDRTATGDKLPMEDMCQLTERLTEHKYKGSYEQIAKAIQRFSSVPKLDMVNYWEQVVFSWITGNADMHLKNFSLYSLGNLLIRSFVLMLGQSLRKLAHILHREFIACGCTVNAAGYIAQLPIDKADKAMRHNL